MSKYSKEDILRMVEEEDVGFIRLQFTDVFGTVKNIAITAGQLEQALNNECSFDGSGIDGFVRIEEDDMYLYPDLDSFEIFPWRPQTGKVARLICDIHKVTTVYSHPQGIMQCDHFLNTHKDWQRIHQANTAMAAKMLLSENDHTHVAISSKKAAQIYGLEVLET